VSLFVYQSNRVEKLVERLTFHTCRNPLNSPFAPEVIVVETQGMAQWLKLELARRVGIVANVAFPFPRAFISDLIVKFVTADARAGAIEPEALAWRVLSRLDNLPPQPEFDEIRHYLDASDDLRRKFQLAERIAALLDQYSVYRPHWIAAWQAGQASHWQALMWRTVMTGGLACQGKFLHELIQALESPHCDRSRLPERLFVVITGCLPPSYLAVFAALARQIHVHLLCLSPSGQYYGDLATPWETDRIQARTGSGDLSPEDLHLERVNPLLASCGKTGRALQQLIADLEPIERQFEDFEDPGTSHLLARIQSSILELEAEPRPTDKASIRSDDRSIQVHACHSPLRELQVLRDQMLDWFAADPELSPGDILVMLTDVEAYVPFVKGVFDVEEDGAPAIPHSVANRSARRESPLTDGFLKVLRLATDRVTATSVMDLLQTTAVRRRFGIAEDDLDQVRLWIQNAAIRWGRDGSHRARLGLPAFEEYTWAHGCSRLLLGYAMADGVGTPVHGLLPCEGIEGTATALLGRWLDFVQQMFAALDDLAIHRTLEGWVVTLNQVLDVLFLPDAHEERAVGGIREVLAALRQQQRVSEFDQPVSLGVILERLVPKLEEDLPGRALLSGAVAFCGLNPMRGIPFKVICMLGMQDGAFPRNPAPPSFDLLAQQPQVGDESRRDDDRYLFLEALLSARDCFYLSYVGQSVRDNTRRPPSVVVSELLDLISSRFCLARMSHPLLKNAEPMSSEGARMRALHSVISPQRRVGGPGLQDAVDRVPSRGETSGDVYSQPGFQSIPSGGEESGLKGTAADVPGNEPPIVQNLLLTVHRLHAFSPAYFLQRQGSDCRLFSYSRAFAAASRVLADSANRPRVEPFLLEPLTNREPCPRNVALRELQRFYRNPSQVFLEKSLEFRLPEDNELLLDEEPFTLDALAAFQCKQEALECGIAGRPASSLLATWKGSGRLPPGPAGDLVGNALLAEADSVLSRARQRMGTARLANQPFALDVGSHTIEGQLTCFSGVGLVHYRAARVDRRKKAAAHLRIWIEHLILQVIGAPAERRSWLVGEDETWVFNEVPEAMEILRQLAGFYERGLAAPLPFFPQTAFAYRIKPERGRKAPEDLANEAWEGNEDDEFQRGEKEDPYFNLCFRKDPDPLGPEFRNLAEKVVDPILSHQDREERR